MDLTRSSRTCKCFTHWLMHSLLFFSYFLLNVFNKESFINHYNFFKHYFIRCDCIYIIIMILKIIDYRLRKILLYWQIRNDKNYSDHSR